jgi:hypothetical protein
MFHYHYLACNAQTAMTPPFNATCSGSLIGNMASHCHIVSRTGPMSFKAVCTKHLDWADGSTMTAHATETITTDNKAVKSRMVIAGKIMHSIHHCAQFHAMGQSLKTPECAPSQQCSLPGAQVTDETKFVWPASQSVISLAAKTLPKHVAHCMLATCHLPMSIWLQPLSSLLPVMLPASHMQVALASGRAHMARTLPTHTTH